MKTKIAGRAKKQLDPLERLDFVAVLPEQSGLARGLFARQHCLH